MRTKAQRFNRRSTQNKPIETQCLNDGDLPIVPIQQAMQLANVQHRATKIANLRALNLNGRKQLTWSEFEDFYRMSVWCRSRLGHRGSRRTEYLILKQKGLLSQAFIKYVMFDVSENLRSIKDGIQQSGIGCRRSGRSST